MSSHIARKVVQHFHLMGPATEEANDLSPREQQVLTLLASGYIYKEIGDKLHIGAETVRTYVKNICYKMHVRSRVEAVAKLRKDSYWTAGANGPDRRRNISRDKPSANHLPPGGQSFRNS